MGKQGITILIIFITTTDIFIFYYDFLMVIIHGKDYDDNN